MRELDAALTGYVQDFARMMAKANARHDFFYSSIFDLYLKEGVLANPKPYTETEERYLLKVFGYISKAPKQKACFYNSQSLALGESLLYAEGQVLVSTLPIPIEHGYNMLPSGKAVDVTLRGKEEPNTCDPKKLLERAKRNQANAYLGIVLPAEEIRLSWARTHMSLMLIETREIIGRILEKGYPLEWRGGLRKYSAEPSQLGEGVLIIPSRLNRAEPSLREFCGIQPSEKYIAGPSPLAFSDRMRGSSQEMAAEPALSGTRGFMSSEKYIGMPSLWVGGGKRPSKKTGARPSPEEEWLRAPEREDAPHDSTRSPFEGDIPPWGQAGYAGVFPLKGKVFYITAYVGSGDRLNRVIKPSLTPVLGDARAIVDVGKMPAGVSFGSEFMFHPFAAIPVRMEDLSEAGPVVRYLAALIEELGAIGKILMEHSFPDAGRTEVRLENGRWFPVNMETQLYGGVGYLNAYSVNRFYGGHQEGGWWYDAGDPIASVPLREEDPAAGIEWAKYLEAKVSWTSKYDRGSVLGHDDFEVYHEDQFAAPFPTETPHYE